MENPLHLLLIDDDEDEYFLLKEMVSRAPFEGVLKRLDLDWISDYEQAAAALRECQYDIYLIDYRLGSQSGLDLLRTATSINCKAPIILLTGQGHYEIDMAAMQLGASDYLVKGELTPFLLERSIRYALERKQHEEILRRSELALRKVQNAAKMGSWYCFPQEDRMEISAEAYHLFRIEKDETTSQSWSIEYVLENWIHPDDRAKIQQTFRSVQEAGKPVGLECQVVWPDGTIREIWAERVEQILDGNGKLSLVAGIVQDITDRKKIEKALLQSEKMAGLGTLAAGMAHEINTPLQVITGASENIQNRLKAGIDVGREELERQVAHINVNAWRIASIVRSLLDYARSSSEEAVSCSLNEIVKATLPLTARQFLAWSNITISTSLIPDLPQVICDPNKLIQVLLNLLNNARDAMPDGGQIMIETSLDEVNNQVVLRVIDTGTGIPEPIQSRIFDPFFTSKPPGKGIGLGLSISMGIVQAAGGVLELEKSSRTGSAFRLALPISSVPRSLNHQPSGG
ncbi:MAG: response regulator [Chloroflexi bacterium]|nr:response regulator [Chloroflexota bacterium]